MLLFIIAVVISQVFSLDACPDYVAENAYYSDCTTLSATHPGGGTVQSYTYDRYYQFKANVTTLKITTSPRKCVLNSAGTAVIAGDLCEFPCDQTVYGIVFQSSTEMQFATSTAKIGGPSGKKCGDFILKSTCLKYYADDGGDRWCYWDDGTSKCKSYMTTTCHN